MIIPEIIKQALKDGEWTFAGKIEEYVRGVDGAKFMTTGRRLREMREDGTLEVKYEKIGGKGPKVAMYRIKQKEPVRYERKMGSPQLSLSF